MSCWLIGILAIHCMTFIWNIKSIFCYLLVNTILTVETNVPLPQRPQRFYLMHFFKQLSEDVNMPKFKWSQAELVHVRSINLTFPKEHWIHYTHIILTTSVQTLSPSFLTLANVHRYEVDSSGLRIMAAQVETFQAHTNTLYFSALLPVRMCLFVHSSVLLLRLNCNMP